MKKLSHYVIRVTTLAELEKAFQFYKLATKRSLHPNTMPVDESELPLFVGLTDASEGRRVTCNSNKYSYETVVEFVDMILLADTKTRIDAYNKVMGISPITEGINLANYCVWVANPTERDLAVKFYQLCSNKSLSKEMRKSGYVGIGTLYGYFQFGEREYITCATDPEEDGSEGVIHFRDIKILANTPERLRIYNEVFGIK